MKTREIIIVNWNSIESINKAEKRKTQLENNGYNLVYTNGNKLIYQLD